MTPANDVVRARVSKELKTQATAVLASIGLTPSDAFRMLLVRIVAERALPFAPLVPNEETVAAMVESREGKLDTFTNLEDLMAAIDAED